MRFLCYTIFCIVTYEIHHTHAAIQSKAMHTENHAELIKKLQSDPEPYQEIRTALQTIGDKWSGLILICLFEKPCRFTDIESLLPGLNPRTLSQRLRDLEDFGLVSRQEYKEFPPRIEYSITSKAEGLKPVMHQLKIWAKKHCKA